MLCDVFLDAMFGTTLLFLERQHHGTEHNHQHKNEYSYHIEVETLYVI